VNVASGKRIGFEALLNRVTEPLRGRAVPNDPPLRAEVFGLEQLIRHAKALAGNHPVVMQRGTNRLLARLDENEQILRAYNRATQVVDQSRRVTHAAEWLLDNFYLIEEQIQMRPPALPLIS
jgi:cyclic beta-1,2-glucan synthetase